MTLIQFFETDQYSMTIQEKIISYKLFSQFLGRKYIKVPNNSLYCRRCVKYTTHLTYRRESGLLANQYMACKMIDV